ncbi:MAG: bifunctional (p)ppGpp synthetase/guanosine-3',5'-bis(diphosphate) 3'-pyrophosphohydrolase [Ardenticatenales bacterium]|nr:bifunctional (p)ppGpp synthetase/guanosine-3',5'-bis(diphosphate) 3'-pyrophosphohydrolase [Ardenticatenales bacterium]
MPTVPNAAAANPADDHSPSDHDVGAAELDRRLAALLGDVERRFGRGDAERVGQAYEAAAAAHASQRRKSGEAYIVHPLAVAQIVADFGLDPDAIAAALLHDVVEDTAVGDDELRRSFGDAVADLVRGVTKISEIEARDITAHQPREGKDKERDRELAHEAENLRRLLLASVDDLRVILIKMADRLHNMQTLGALKPERQARMARETLEIYAPLANRLGIWQFKSHFEDLSLKVLEPETYHLIDTVLSGRRAEHEAYLEAAIRTLQERLEAAGIDAVIKARAKHITSVYAKMKRKDMDADQILDVLAMRVLVDSNERCYSALGVIHQLWDPMEGEFDDYIAKKKPNLYRSLHTTVKGPDNRPLEIQIRTHDMDELAEYGIAAHWIYKENANLSAEVQRQIAELRRTLESRDADAPDALTFVEGLKADVFRDQVYVFTPKGRVLELPTGATPIDFAYRIHSEVGNRCRGALVNGKMVALNTPLNTGDTVKIVTTKGDDAGPSRDWANPALGYVVSAHARERIKQYFRRQIRSDSIRQGRDVVERVLRKLGMTRTKLEAVARLFGDDGVDDFLAAVGRQEIAAQTLSQRLLEHEATTLPPPKAKPIEPHGVPKTTAPVTLFGADQVQTRIARCCNPLPGEPVVGYLTRGRGVTLHRTDCRNIAAQRAREPERFIQVAWAPRKSQTVPVVLNVYAIDRSGLARDIADVISKSGINMQGISAIARDRDALAVVAVVVELESTDQLADLLDKLQNVTNVIEVRRTAG